MDITNIAFIGCGSMAGAHCNSLKLLWEAGCREFEAIAVCDIDKEKAVETAQSLPHEAVCRFTVLAEIDKNPSTDEINKCLSHITFRDNAEHDTLVIDFGIDMIPMVEECDLLEKITEARKNAGKDKKGRDKIPPVRVRDNTELAPTQVRLRYYSDYLLNKQFTDNTACVDELITILQNL